ncbi:MAG: hypothetical protein R2708_27245 [Vicinamibacterales bacterium]
MAPWLPVDDQCDHGAPAARCPQCREAARQDPLALVIAILTVAGLLLLGGRAARLEAVSEREQLQRHLQRLEQHQPGALDRLTAIAADARRKE